MTIDEISRNVENTLSDWRLAEKKALKILKLTGELRFDRGIEVVMFRKGIYNSRPSELINQHLFATNYIDQRIPLDLSLEILSKIGDNKNIKPAFIDLGILATDFIQAKKDQVELDDFLSEKLVKFIKSDTDSTVAPKDVVLYGFGRIGRLLARRIILLTGQGNQLRLKAIVIRPKMANVKDELEKRAGLLQYDSVHGEFEGAIEIDAEDSSMIINGNTVKIIFAGSPEDIDYTDYGIEAGIVIDNTGMWRSKEDLSRHLRPGIEKVMLTAPGDGMPNIVYGSNHDVSTAEDHQIISAASCTTNAIVPVIQVIDQLIGIEGGHIETIHAYTSDQNLLDNFHKKTRRGRGAAVNMVLTTTGAAKAVSKVLPHLHGKLTGNAVRVPTPNVSIAILILELKKPSTVEEINEMLKNASLHGELVEQIHYSSSTEFVSSHAIGTTSTSVVDGPSTLMSHDGRRATIYVWYDNEFGYCCQVVRLAKHFAKVRRVHYY